MAKNRSTFFLLTIAFPLCGLLSMAHAQTPEKPNILLIVADDVAFGDLGISGSVVQTPNLDRLSEEGVMFTRFHSSPVCSVSRAMLLTGNNPIEIGLSAFDYSLYPPAEGKPGYESYLTRTTVTIAELLQDAGYWTCMVGKWHLGGTAHGGEGPKEWGFDRSYGIYTGGANHWNQGVFHVDMHDPKVVEQVKAGIVPTEPYYENGKSVDRPLGIYSDSLWTSKILEYIEEGRKEKKPFFAYVAYTTPHAPVQAPDFLIEKYVDHYLKLGFEGLKRERFEAQKELGIIPPSAQFPDSDANRLLRAWESLSEEEQLRAAWSMATYSAMMESQDYHIGLILNYLRETGQLDNTLIVYMSDNGPEGTEDRGELSNPSATKWIEDNFSMDMADIGNGNAFAFIGTDFANATTGGLQWWKWFISEGGVRVPMLIIPPKNTAFQRVAQKTDTFACVKDIPMTILDYAGVAHPQTKFKERETVPPSGLSMRKFLEKKADVVRTEDQWVVLELFGNSYIVSGEYKAIRVRPAMYSDGLWHLYNIKTDPGETTPLDEEEPERLAKLISIYENFAEEKGIVPVADNWSPWHGFIEE